VFSSLLLPSPLIYILFPYTTLFRSATEHEFYGRWVNMYSSEEFTKLANYCIDLMNKLAEGKPEHELVALEDIVVKTSYFEYMFWDMAENQSMWPVEVDGKISVR